VLRTVNFIAFPDSFPMTEQRKYGLDLNEIFRSNAWWSNLFEESESNFERGVVDSWTLPDAEFEYDYRNAVRHASKFVQGPTPLVKRKSRILISIKNVGLVKKLDRNLIET